MVNFGKTILIIAILGTLVSCFKEPNFSMTPNIKYKDFSKDLILDEFTGGTKDTIVVNIEFQDGDGDLGLGEDDKADAVANNNFNYIVKAYRKKNGSFTAYEPLEPISGFFPKLADDTKPGPIEGTLSYGMDFYHAFTPKFDTLKFEIQIKDRAGNLSNTVETDDIVLNAIESN